MDSQQAIEHVTEAAKKAREMAVTEIRDALEVIIEQITGQAELLDRARQGLNLVKDADVAFFFHCGEVGAFGVNGTIRVTLPGGRTVRWDAPIIVAPPGTYKGVLLLYRVKED